MLVFRTLTDERHLDAVWEMMRELYAGDAISSAALSHRPIDTTRFPQTIRHFLNQPEQGRVVLFQEDDRVQGYAILVPYWSNEFGGRLVFVDELFVREEARGQGIAKAFFRELRQNPPFEAVALALEVGPENERARRLYLRIGFHPRAYSTLVCELDE